MITLFAKTTKVIHWRGAVLSTEEAERIIESKRRQRKLYSSLEDHHNQRADHFRDLAATAEKDQADLEDHIQAAYDLGRAS